MDDVISQIRNEMAENGEERTPDQLRKWIWQQYLLFAEWLHDLITDDPDLLCKLFEPTTLEEKRKVVAELADEGFEITVEFIDQVRDIYGLLNDLCADDEDDGDGERPPEDF